MRSRSRTSILAALLGLGLSHAASAAAGVRLASLAAAAGYSYSWIATEGGVTLQRPGIVIVLHAGYPLYEVNTTPMQADSPPRFDHGDLVVSPALAERLRRLAAAYPSPPAGAPILASRTAGGDGAGPAASGPLTLQARPVPGHEALAISGTAPANAAVTITLTAEVSRDLPAVLLSRTSVTSGADGTFSTVTSTDQNPHRGTSIVVVASTGSTTAPAIARIVVDAPSPGIHSILDEFPPK